MAVSQHSSNFVASIIYLGTKPICSLLISLCSTLHATHTTPEKRMHMHTYREAVKKGNKVFGAAILRLSDLSLVVAGTNTEIECPLWHGEVRERGAK